MTYKSPILKMAHETASTIGLEFMDRHKPALVRGVVANSLSISWLSRCLLGGEVDIPRILNTNAQAVAISEGSTYSDQEVTALRQDPELIARVIAAEQAA